MVTAWTLNAYCWPRELLRGVFIRTAFKLCLGLLQYPFRQIDGKELCFIYYQKG